MQVSIGIQKMTLQNGKRLQVLQKLLLIMLNKNGYRLADNYADIFLQRLIRKSFGAKTLVEVNVFGGIGMVSFRIWRMVCRWPLQEMVDSYEMAATGETPVLGYDENDNQIINLKSGYDPVHPFEGRDPRFLL